MSGKGEFRLDERYCRDLDRQNEAAMQRDDLEDMDFAARERVRGFAQRLSEGFQIIGLADGTVGECE